jgi:hypothetical protein
MNGRYARGSLLAFLICGCGGLLGGSSDQSGSHAAGGAVAVSPSGGALTTGGQQAVGSAPTTAGAAAGGLTNASGSSASGGVPGAGGATGGAAGNPDMDCGWEDIQCGGLSPSCAAGSTFVKVAACSGPCISIQQCPANWTAGTDALTVGVWLIGWVGDLNHFSVVRFNDDYSVQYLEAQIAYNQSYFPCLGNGQWGPLPMQGAIHVGYPADCSETGTNGTGLTFGSFSSANGQWGAAMHATITVGASTPVEGYWFPTGTCSPAANDCPIGAG